MGAARRAPAESPEAAPNACVFWPFFSECARLEFICLCVCVCLCVCGWEPGIPLRSLQRTAPSRRSDRERKAERIYSSSTSFSERQTQFEYLRCLSIQLLGQLRSPGADGPQACPSASTSNQ